MSNLYKSWFTRTENDKMRVIKSDDLVAELLKRRAAMEGERAKAASVQGVGAEGGNPDEFNPGILGDASGNVIKAEPDEDEREKAKKEAERLLAEAKREAEEIVSTAQAKRQEIADAARDEGYAEGSRQVEQELNLLRSQLQVSFEEKKSELESEYTRKRTVMERDLVEVILEVFNRVFHIQFDHKKQILIHLIEQAILNIEGDKKFRIKVAESNVAFLENHMEQMLDRIGHDVELEVVTDQGLDGNDCIIETDSGVFDCSLGVQLENLVKDIRSLCS